MEVLRDIELGLWQIVLLKPMENCSNLLVPRNYALL